MGEIRVNTDQLRVSADILRGTSSTLDRAAQAVHSASASADPGKYQGQLAAQVSSLASSASGSTGALRSGADRLQGELLFRADAFDVANEAGASAMLQPSWRLAALEKNSPLLGLFSRLRQLGVGTADAIWRMGGFIRGQAFGLYSTTLVPLFSNLVWNGRTFVGQTVPRYLTPEGSAILTPKALGVVGQLDKWSSPLDLLKGFSLRAGVTYPGQLKVFGSEFYKKWILGFNPHLTHISEARLAQQIVSDKISIRGNGLLTGTKVASAWTQDYYKYRDAGIEKVLVAGSVDTFKEAASLTAFSAGFTLGFGLGIFTGPGAIVLGLAAGVAAQWAVDYVYETPLTQLLPQLGGIAGMAIGSTVVPIGPFAGVLVGKRTETAVATLISGKQWSQLTFRDLAIEGLTKVVTVSGETLGNSAFAASTEMDRIFDSIIRSIQSAPVAP